MEWVNKVRTSPDTLSIVRYEQLIKPKLKYTVTNFSSVVTGLFDHILSKYRGWMGKQSSLKKRGNNSQSNQLENESKIP